MVVSPRQYVLVIVGSVVLSVALVAAVWPWTRQLRILVSIGLSVVVGIVIWNTLLNVTNAQELAQRGAVAAARDVRVQAIGDDADERIGRGRPVGGIQPYSQPKTGSVTSSKHITLDESTYRWNMAA